LSSFLLSCRIVSFVLRISKELTPQRQLKEDAVLVVDQLMVLVQYTAELYQELQVLYRLEKDYEQKRREEENSANSSKGDGLAILKTELKAQRKVVKSLKKKSLWSRGFEEVCTDLSTNTTNPSAIWCKCIILNHFKHYTSPTKIQSNQISCFKKSC
jgi:uncharacterized membrane protein YcjF (UPF0283 family)